MLEKLFSPKGRVTRLQNLGYELLVFVSMWVVGAVLSFAVFGTMYLVGVSNESLAPGSGLSIIFLPLTLVAMYSNIIIKIKRLHDMNLSGWWLPIFLLLAIPYIALYFWPGTKGKNRFDEDNDKTINNSTPSLAKAVVNHTKDTACNIKYSGHNCKDSNQKELDISAPKAIDEDKNLKKEVNLTEETNDASFKTIEEYTCNKCLTVNKPSDLFCKECGNKLGENSENKVDELLKWHKLYDAGALTEEEFNKKKKELI